MSEQSEIPAPTPEDDVIEHQERVEFLIDKKFETLPPPPKSPVIFRVDNSGDNNSLFVSTVEANVTSDGQAGLSGTALVVNMGPGGYIKPVRARVPGDTQTIHVPYLEIVVCKLGSTDRILAYAQNIDVDAPEEPSSGDNITLTTAYDIVGTDLSLSGGHIVSAAGGNFIVTFGAYVQFV